MILLNIDTNDTPYTSRQQPKNFFAVSALRACPVSHFISRFLFLRSWFYHYPGTTSLRSCMATGVGGGWLPAYTIIVSWPAGGGRSVRMCTFRGLRCALRKF